MALIKKISAAPIATASDNGKPSANASREAEAQRKSQHVAVLRFGKSH